ncbi:MAG: copper amine oxidase N-terminal domain-containing protein [Defluviitaleaceae bacterium]|nr:copper amine oxidase N-terminal domain-containing protein [Defluviitaleaceae bacterium]
MKKFIITALMVLAMATTAFADAIIDEYGNIIQENEVLEGGIMTLAGDIGDFDFVPFPAFGSVAGEVVEIGDFIKISIDDTHTNLIVDDNTFFHGEKPEVGDTIIGFFDNNLPMAMIYPPQHTAVAIVNTDVIRIILDRFDEEWISSGQQFRLNIEEDTPIYFQDGSAFEGEKEELIGRKLLVQFARSHRDIPETIPSPELITVLFERAVPPMQEIDYDFGIWDAAVNDPWLMMAINLNWYGQEITDPSAYNIIITINDVARGIQGASPTTVGEYYFPNYLPLRAISEALGFEPQWNAADREITIGTPHGQATFRLDIPYYAVVSSEGVASTHAMPAPVSIDGHTYVPFAFFRDIFGFPNVWFEGGTIFLDNGERME